MKIAIFPKRSDPAVRACADAVCRKLTALGCQPCFCADARDRVGDIAGSLWYDDRSAMLADCECCIGIGGDGTLLHAAKYAAEFDRPILGINCGRLGYLCALETDELNRLDDLAAGNYHTMRRMMLDVTVDTPAGTRARFRALNDAVLANDSLVETIDVRVSRDQTDILRFRGDGVILSTPTGSTAYALSAGGPIIDPALRAVSVTPICPHSFSTKTTIFACPTSLQARATAVKGKVYLTVDGEQCVPIAADERITVTESAVSAAFILFDDLDFNRILHKKFNLSDSDEN